MNSSLPDEPDDTTCFELQYRAYYLAADVRQTCIAIAVWLVPILLFAYPEYLIFGYSSAFALMLGLRLVFCGFSLYTIALLRRAVTAREYDHAFQCWAIFAVIFVLIANFSWSAHVVPSGTITILIVFSSYMVFPNKLSIRIAYPLILSVSNLILHWMAAEQSGPYTNLSALVSVVMVNVLGMIFSASMQNHRRTEFKARLEESRVKEKLSKLASVDDLTGVFNRRRLLQFATAEFDRYKSNGQQFSILMIDIDHFKRLNDTYGHETGDTVLSTFAAYVASNLRETDIWGRVGGEEFVLILPGLLSEQAKCIAERLRLGVEREYIASLGNLFSFTISIGVAEVQSQDRSFQDVLRRADSALYHAKHNGRNRTEFS